MAFAETFDQIKKWCLGINNVGEADEAIRRDNLLQQGLKTWSKRLGTTALVLGGLCVLGAAGVILAPTVVVGAAYGLVKLASYMVNRDIKNKRAAAQEIAAHQAEAAVQAPKPSRQPAPKATVKVSGAFNAKVTAQPAANDAEAAPAQKPVSFFKRFGIGG